MQNKTLWNEEKAKWEGMHSLCVLAALTALFTRIWRLRGHYAEVFKVFAALTHTPHFYLFHRNQCRTARTMALLSDATALKSLMHS